MYDQNYMQDRRQSRPYGAQNVSISSKRDMGQGRNKYQPQPPIEPGVIPDIQKYNNANVNPNYNRNYDNNPNPNPYSNPYSNPYPNTYSNPNIKPGINHSVQNDPSPSPMPVNYSPYGQPSTMRRMNDQNSTSKNPIENPPPTADKGVVESKTAEENNYQNINVEEDNKPPLTRVDFCGILFSGFALRS